MSTITEPLREEHKALLPHIEHIRVVADLVGETTPETMRKAVGEVCEFLHRHLIPHAHAEDRILYPVVANLMGAPGATATMSRDHVEVRRLTEELEATRSQPFTPTPGGAHAKALRRVLYGLYALVRVHFAKEEEIYLPLLDARLPADEVRRLLEEMRKAVGGAESHAGHR